MQRGRRCASGVTSSSIEERVGRKYVSLCFGEHLAA